MKKILLFFIIFFNIVVLLNSFPIMGARSLSMGGTGVASTNNVSNIYWNPAKLSFIDNNIFSIKFDAGAGVMQNMSEQISMLDNLDEDYEEFISNVENSLNWTDSAQLDELTEFYNHYKGVFSEFDNAGVGGDLNLNGGTFFKVKDLKLFFDMGFGIIVTSTNQFYSESVDTRFSRIIPTEYLSRNEISNAYPSATQSEITAIIETILNDLNSRGVLETDEYDNLYDYLVVQENDINSPGSPFGIDNNESKVTVDGILLNEIAVSLSKKINIEKLIGFSVGGNIKLINGYNYYQQFGVEEFKEDSSDTNDNDDVFDKFDDPLKGNTYGIDMSVYVKLLETLHVGITARNIVAGEIDWKPNNGIDRPNYKPETSVRIGAMMEPTQNIKIAADADLTKRDGEYSDIRNIGIGAEFCIFKFLNLRAGSIITPGLENKLDKSNMLITGGFGLDFKIINIDLGIAMSPKDTGFNFDEENLPERVQGALSVGINF